MTRIIKADATVDPSATKAGILNMPDFAAEARRIVLEARKDAARIMSEARAEAESIQRRARQDGYAEGFARGQNDGHTEGGRQARADVGKEIAGEYAELLAWAKEVVAGLSAAQAESRRHGSGGILEMAVLLAEKIVGRVAAVDVEAAKANLAKVLELAHFASKVVVRVNPGQLEALREAFRDLVDALGAGGMVRLVGDERICPGGVKLVSRHGQIDATIETQLANVARVLLGEEDPLRSECGPGGPTETGLYEPAAEAAAEGSGRV